MDGWLLRREELAEEYCRKVGEVVRGVEEQEGEELGEWEKVSKPVKAAAREVCGVVRGKIAQPWMVGREEEVSRLSEDNRLAVQEWDNFLEIGRARNILRPRRDDRRGMG